MQYARSTRYSVLPGRAPKWLCVVRVYFVTWAKLTTFAVSHYNQEKMVRLLSTSIQGPSAAVSTVLSTPVLGRRRGHAQGNRTSKPPENESLGATMLFLMDLHTPGATI